MTVLILDLPVLAIDVELGTLVLADLAPGINGILLLVEMAAATGRSVFLNVPTASGVWALHDVILVSLAWLPPVYL